VVIRSPEAHEISYIVKPRELRRILVCVIDTFFPTSRSTLWAASGAMAATDRSNANVRANIFTVKARPVGADSHCALAPPLLSNTDPEIRAASAAKGQRVANLS
jgi:hypothetical protein